MTTTDLEDLAPTTDGLLAFEKRLGSVGRRYRPTKIMMTLFPRIHCRRMAMSIELLEACLFIRAVRELLEKEEGALCHR